MSEFNHRFMVITNERNRRYVVKYHDNLPDSAILKEFMHTHFFEDYTVQFRSSAPNSRNVFETWLAIEDGDSGYFRLDYLGM